MESELYWKIFCATGDPMAYMLYRTAEAPKNGPTA